MNIALWTVQVLWGVFFSVTESASGSSSEQVTLNWDKWVRQTHRWLCIAFTVAVIVNIVAVVQGKYTFSEASPQTHEACTAVSGQLSAISRLTK
jgi:hypothetical protein